MKANEIKSEQNLIGTQNLKDDKSLKAPPNQQIEAQFNEFDLESSRNVKIIYIEISC